MTIGEWLQSLPEEKREAAADFIYGRTPCRQGLNDQEHIQPEDTQAPVLTPGLPAQKR